MNEKLKILHSSANPKHEKFDETLFISSKAMLGGWANIIITGSSPIAADVLDYLKVIFCCQIYEGWGLTETTGISTLT